MKQNPLTSVDKKNERGTSKIHKNTGKRARSRSRRSTSRSSSNRSSSKRKRRHRKRRRHHKSRTHRRTSSRHHRRKSPSYSPSSCRSRSSSSKEQRRRRTRRGRSRHRSSSEDRGRSRHRRHCRKHHRDSTRHHRRRNRHYRSSYSRSSSSSENMDRLRRRMRKRDRREDKHHDASSSDSHTAPLSPVVAAAAPPRAGIVVSEDEDAAATTVITAPTTKRSILPRGLFKRKEKGRPRSRSASSSGGGDDYTEDDLVGHYPATEGSVVADRFQIVRQIGIGTFGKVLECLDMKNQGKNKKQRRRKSRIGCWNPNQHFEQKGSTVALKIVRNIKRYHESALMEAEIVDDVNRRGGRGLSHCAVMFDSFSFQGHYCMVFERLGPSLYDFMKRQNYQPFPSRCVREFAIQLLETLEFLHRMRLIHTDLKPENILLLNHREIPYRGYTIPECTRIKVIDFGGATYDKDKKSSIVNTRQYRAPEVMLGTGWSMPSDLWSCGCILAELYQGELLFATHDNSEHLALIEQVVSPFPCRMLTHAKNRDIVDASFEKCGMHRMGRVLSQESLAYVRRQRSLSAMVYDNDEWFLRLLRRILVIDPQKRYTASECLQQF